MSEPPRRLIAWRKAFDLAVEVFHVTSAVEDGRTNGLASRLRRTALRVPALVTRAAGRRRRPAFHSDLRAALVALAALEEQLRVCAVLIYVEPGELRRVVDRLGDSRQAIVTLSAGAGPRLERRPAVEGLRPKV